MKKNTKFIMLTLLFAMFGISVQVNAQTHVDSLLFTLHKPQSKYVFVIAHRADWRNAPENSIDAILRSIRMGVDMVEIDIKKTKDDQFVLMHDYTIDRTTTGKGAVADYTLAELKKYRLKAGHNIKTYERIPTLREILWLCKDKILVNIDGGGDYIKDISSILKETGTEKQVVIKGTYGVDRVKLDYGNEPDMLYMPIIRLPDKNAGGKVRDFLEKYKPVAFELCFENEKALDNTLLDVIIKKGSRIWINTLWDDLCAGHDDEQAIIDPDANWGWILMHKASMIQTDRPYELIAYLNSKGLRKLNE